MKLTNAQVASVLFVGKEIKMIDASSTNCWFFYFTDGSCACIDGTALKASLYHSGAKHALLVEA